MLVNRTIHESHEEKLQGTVESILVISYVSELYLPDNI